MASGAAATVLGVFSRVSSGWPIGFPARTKTPARYFTASDVGSTRGTVDDAVCGSESYEYSPRHGIVYKKDNPRLDPKPSTGWAQS